MSNRRTTVSTAETLQPQVVQQTLEYGTLVIRRLIRLDAIMTRLPRLALSIMNHRERFRSRIPYVLPCPEPTQPVEDSTPLDVFLLLAQGQATNVTNDQLDALTLDDLACFYRYGTEPLYFGMATAVYRDDLATLLRRWVEDVSSSQAVEILRRVSLACPQA